MSSRESDSRNTKAKLAAEMVLKLEKSDVNLYMGIRNCCEEKDAIWIDLIFILLVGWHVHFRFSAC